MRIFLTGFMVLISCWANAQELSSPPNTYKFTLEEAINFALDSSYNAINAKRDIARCIMSTGSNLNMHTMKRIYTHSLCMIAG